MVDNFRILYCFLHNLIHHVDDEWCQTIEYQYTRQTCKRLEEKTGFEEDYTSLVFRYVCIYSIENNSIYHFFQFSSRIFSNFFYHFYDPFPCMHMHDGQWWEPTYFWKIFLILLYFMAVTSTRLSRHRPYMNTSRKTSTK